MQKIAFVSPHCVFDFTNGAATATLDGLSLLSQSGFECQAFCSSRMDAWEEVLVEEILAKRQVHYEVRNAKIGAYRGRMVFTTHGRVAVTLFARPRPAAAGSTPRRSRPFSRPAIFF